MVAAVNKLTKETRHGHDNMPSDVLKDLAKFAERNTTNQLATEFLVLFTEFINLTFIDHKCPKELREFYNGGEVFGLTTAVKANRSIYCNYIFQGSGNDWNKKYHGEGGNPIPGIRTGWGRSLGPKR